MTSQTELSPLHIIRQRTAAEENKDVNETADRFRERFEKGTNNQNTTTMVNEYYDLVTDFYEYGWGQQFHFAPRFNGETFYESLARHEFFLALKGSFKPTDTVVDIGCGVGGPARNMVRFSGCNVVGINNNSYQISRARRHDALQGFSSKIDYMKGDFCNLSIENNQFDGAYAIEATCHAADRVKCYSEIYRILKPGACFVVYEWCVTDKYDPNNKEHNAIRHGIELGDALPPMVTTHACTEAMKKAGFILEESFDLIQKFDESPIKTIPWYQPLDSNYSTLNGIKSTPIGRLCTKTLCRALEAVRLAPKGTTKSAEILEEAAVNLVKGGKTGIFTPCFFMKGRKSIDS